MRKNYLLAAACLWCAQSYSQNVLQLGWDFTGNAGNELSVVASTNNVNLETSVITRGAGLTVASLANSFSAGGWTTTNSLTDAIANNDYLQFSVKARSSFVTSLSLLEAVFRRSSTGPDHFQWQYSIDGTIFININSEIIYTNTTTNGLAQLPVDLSGNAAFQSVSSATTITLRLYGYNASSAGGTFAIGRLSGNDLGVTGTTQSITPVKLLTFLGSVQEGYTELSWSTAYEISSHKYEVEHSSDGKVFKKIAEIISYNNHNGSNYFFRDRNYGGGKNFYRLRIVDSDSLATYSKVILVNGKERIALLAYPNPTGKFLIIQYPKIKQQSMLCIVGIDGRVYKQYALPAQSSQITITTDYLLRGNYVLAWSCAAGIYSTRFSKW